MKVFWEIENCLESFNVYIFLAERQNYDGRVFFAAFDTKNALVGYLKRS